MHFIRKHNGKLFVGCDCYRSDCPCKHSYDVPEQLLIAQSDLTDMSEIERAKAIIAAAPRCLNHGAPMTGRMERYGLFGFCTVKDCEYTKTLETRRNVG